MKSSGFKAFSAFAVGALVSLLATPAHPYGFGAKAGPFEVVLETDEPEQDFVILLDNYSAPGNHGPGLTGGGYIKITHGPSNTPIHFPRDWLYKWNSAGESSLSGLVMHPKYLTASFYVSPDLDKDDEVRVGYGVSYVLKGFYNVSVNKPIPIRIKMVPIELYLETMLAKKSESELRNYIDSGYYEGDWGLLTDVEKLRACKAKGWSHSAFDKSKYFHYFLEIGMLDEVLARYEPYLLNMQSKYMGHIPDRRDATGAIALRSSKMKSYIERISLRNFGLGETVGVVGKKEYEVVVQ